MNEGELRKLDVFLAEHIMGWEKEKKYGTPPYGICWWVDSSFAYKWIKPAQGWGKWHPTESISDAFQVVEKMMERFPDWFCTVDIFGQNYNKQDKGKGHCVVTFQESAEGYIIYSCEQAETAPLAICLAAKKAVEETE